MSRTTDRLALELTQHLFRVSHPTDGQVFQNKALRENCGLDTPSKNGQRGIARLNEDLKEK